MRVTLDKYQHRLLSRVLRWTLTQARDSKPYGIEEILKPFAVDELEALLYQVDPTAQPVSVVPLKETKGGAA